MKSTSSIVLGVALATAAGCAATRVPTAKLEPAESALRAAEALGADGDAQASMHAHLARIELAEARRRFGLGDTDRAELALLRARADAELALALARTAKLRSEAQSAFDEARGLRGGAP